MKRIFLFLAAILVASWAMADHPFDDSEDFLAGYSDGFRHGVEDMRARVSFDFTHAPEYQEGMSYYSRNSCEFRVGYAEGYTDGFFRRRARYAVGGDHSHNHGDPYDDREGTVLAFTEPGYRGAAKVFETGRYPYLAEGWDDKIESIQISGDVRVILFDQRDFRGERMVVDGDSSDLRYFRRKAASMIVEPRRLARY